MSSEDPISPDSDAQSQNAEEWQVPEIASGLYIVATPIGNRRDITLRALDILRAADIVLAEDTRHSSKLLSAYNIKSQLVSYYDHNVAQRLPDVLDRLAEGKIIAQISDAGTPLVSDPGYKLVAAAIEAGHRVVPVPGPSSVLAALMGAGLPSDRFSFVGFLPPKSGQRRQVLADLKLQKGTQIFFESGSRLPATLGDMLSVLGDRPAVLARELTKIYEEFRRMTLSELVKSVEADPPRGEIVLLVGSDPEEGRWSADTVDRALKLRLPNMKVKQASAEVADLSGWSKRDVYQRALELK